MGDPNNDGSPLIELWDLNNQKKIHKWNLNTSEILKKINISKKDNAVRFLHPLLLNDGSITITHLGGAIVKISPRGELIKFNDEYIFHHSQEIDNQGKIYTPIHTLPEGYTDPNMKKLSYREGFAILDQELND